MGRDRSEGAGEGPVVRRARADDVAAIVALLADDTLGAGREHLGELGRYQQAFALIDADPSELLVVLDDDGEVAGTAQLSFLPGLTLGATTRLQIEGVRIAASHRGRGLGHRLLRWAEDEGRRRGCGLIQLTTNNVRVDAHRFYADLGYEASHVGFKRVL